MSVFHGWLPKREEWPQYRTEKGSLPGRPLRAASREAQGRDQGGQLQEGRPIARSLLARVEQREMKEGPPRREQAWGELKAEHREEQVWS
ncbi:hypothetical protein GOP47_0009760 [Adiantum capillus-veneris]|uniref:Uncharacterized protein n=1 Tax=Adiantum capillus-veneris TaxID=13818 RepID=A0A9D4ZHI7_ADICA|nr:hypothetical protein GOP47_0009760 [Adiantum capillus-veneris]